MGQCYEQFSLEERCTLSDLAKPGKQSAKSQQLWIARHRP